MITQRCDSLTVTQSFPIMKFQGLRPTFQGQDISIADLTLRLPGSLNGLLPTLNDSFPEYFPECDQNGDDDKSFITGWIRLTDDPCSIEVNQQSNSHDVDESYSIDQPTPKQDAGQNDE